MIKTTIKIEGMACGMCEAHMNDALRAAFAPKKASSSHKDRVSVIITEEAPDEAKLRETVEKAGYTFLGASSEPYEKKGFSLFKK